MTTRTYDDLIKLKTFQERFEYLKLDSTVGEPTYGYDRWINQEFYRSPEWKKVRNLIIVRDQACDLAMDGYELNSDIVIHHMNPIMLMDIVDRTEFLMKPEYLVCCSRKTHNAIHYGFSKEAPKLFAERHENDQCPWR